MDHLHSPDDAALLLRRHAEVLDLIARAAPLAETLAQVARTLEELQPGATCSILLADQRAGVLRHSAGPSLPPDYCRAIDGLPIAEGAGACGSAAWSGTVVVSRDVREDPRWKSYRELAEAAGLRSCWSTPVRDADGVLGTFAVYRPVPHEPDTRERALVAQVAHLADVAIRHARLHGRLTATAERFRRTFDDNTVGMALVRTDGILHRANTSLRALAARSGAVLPTGAPLERFLRPVDEEADLATILRRVADGRSGRETFAAHLGPRRDRPTRVEATVTALPSTDEGAVELCVSLVDLTERYLAQRHELAHREAETARRTAEKLNRAKSDLLRGVSHELRTPLQAITGFTELLGRGDLSDERVATALHHIDSAAAHVLSLVDDVLDLSRFEVGSAVLASEELDLDTVIVEVVDMLSPAAESHGATVVHERTPVRVLGDRRRVRQVLLNLVGNALRHGLPGGNVVVRTTLLDGSTVTAVVDDGHGVDPDLLPRLFVAFEDLTQDERMAVTGFGLGLLLSRQLALGMGGDLTVANNHGAGATFRLVLPRATDEA